MIDWQTLPANISEKQVRLQAIVKDTWPFASDSLPHEAGTRLAESPGLQLLLNTLGLLPVQLDARHCVDGSIRAELKSEPCTAR